MRFTSLFLLSLPCMATSALAESWLETPLRGVSLVSYSLPAEVSLSQQNAGFQTDGSRDVPFALGRPDGSGDVLVQTAPRARASVAQNRTKKAFSLPWQVGVFQ